MWAFPDLYDYFPAPSMDILISCANLSLNLNFGEFWWKFEFFSLSNYGEHVHGGENWKLSCFFMVFKHDFQLHKKTKNFGVKNAILQKFRG